MDRVPSETKVFQGAEYIKRITKDDIAVVRKDVPLLQLKGGYLNFYGFPVDTEVHIQIQMGVITLTAID